MVATNKSRVGYINSKLLGSMRDTVEVVTEEQEQEPIESIMKEVETETTEDRNAVIDMCQDLLSGELTPLNKEFTFNYLNFAFQTSLPPQMVALDASQPWMLYWIANSLSILDPNNLTDDIKRGIVAKLFNISKDKGPFGGGEGQLPHIASTYAAVNALALCDNIDDCWNQLDTKAIHDWLLSLKQADGGFKTCRLIGEVDTRGVYCALTVASLLNIMTDELTSGVAEYLQRCQTYEGGFGGTPLEDEAHGGYTFCAVASLLILNKLDSINIEKLSEWCSARQYNEEMGLSGRSNKLVDGCYSFWVGATAAMLEGENHDIPINKDALRRYILNCCQSDERPGLRDKPGKNADFYHTNYVLLGLIITESTFTYKNEKTPFNLISEPSVVTDAPSNLVPINPIYGLPVSAVEKFHNHFA